MGCTIGAKVTKRGEEYFLFKNKDLPWLDFEDRILVEPTRFGVLGVHLPKGLSLAAPRLLSGFSIGVNSAGVAACNSHVTSVADALNYDDLTEAAVTGTRSVAEAIAQVRELACQESYNWANIIVADPEAVAVIEIGADVVHAAGLAEVARANAHLLSHGGAARAAPDARCTRAAQGVAKARGLADFRALLGSHEDREQHGNICTHGRYRQGYTVYSYVIHWRSGCPTFHVCRGNPCENEYIAVPVCGGAAADDVARLYPSSAPV